MKAVTALSPITLKPLSVSGFWDDVDELMDQVRQRAYQLFEGRGRAEGNDLEDWFKAETELLKPVPLEIAEKDDVIRVRAEVPGFKDNEIEINLEPGAFTIKGEHREETETKDEKKFHSERYAQQIFRRVPLPVNVLPEKATATLKDGVLELSLPKAELARKIEIKAA
ncbi:MAG: Hsp20 family protein [Candidatus Angelobacter sp.]